MVDHAKAVRPFDDHSGFVGDTGNLGLLGKALRPTFGKSRCKDNRCANLACSEAAHGIKNSRLRNRQHGDVDALGQRIDRGEAFARANRLAVGVDRIDLA